jgi:hypothetical protein
MVVKGWQGAVASSKLEANEANDQHHSTSYPRLKLPRAFFTLMLASFSSPADEIVHLKRQLVIAEERLERAQRLFLHLRCLAARKGQRGFWMRDRDQSGLRSTLWGEKDGLGSWILVKVNLPAFFLYRCRCSSLLCPQR